MSFRPHVLVTVLMSSSEILFGGPRFGFCRGVLTGRTVVVFKNLKI